MKIFLRGLIICSDDYEKKVLDLVRYIYNIVPEEHEFSGLKATPSINTYPEINQVEVMDLTLLLVEMKKSLAYKYSEAFRE